MRIESGNEIFTRRAMVAGLLAALVAGPVIVAAPSEAQAQERQFVGPSHTPRVQRPRSHAGDGRPRLDNHRGSVESVKPGHQATAPGEPLDEAGAPGGMVVPRNPPATRPRADVPRRKHIYIRMCMVIP